jgi:hypothetical protein
MALGGAAGTRLSRQFGIETSEPTVLRQLRASRAERAMPEPRVVGIDDWAWRKGHRYGTILCDLERGRVIDMLADRSSASTEQWLRRHPGIEIVSRDRASLYAEAAGKALPHAVQVADRWHLLHNLSEALVNTLAPHHRLINEVARAVHQKASPPPPVSAPPEIMPAVSRSGLAKQHNRERRLALYEAAVQRLRQGESQATEPNQVWALDFVHDVTVSVRSIRVLNVIDAYTRESLAMEVDTSFAWRRDYNERRPHSSLNYLTPAEFARRQSRGKDVDSVHLENDQTVFHFTSAPTAA